MSNPYLYAIGSEQHLEATVTAAAVDLVDQPVWLTLDGTTMLPAEWLGAVGRKRVARTVTPVVFASYGVGSRVVWAKVSASPEAPLLRAGTITITPGPA